ncbi:hypothetical protein ElyMa_005059000 [Elysia marginata]|uniref:HTH psq-type domain-containing protein n=1 Tax=Elysia marginata TaxID=1093978 RepID=A0AAV4JES5_9GAST|nr:hypothetical protein ElyMa_005059000 [Elysia marginata]
MGKTQTKKEIADKYGIPVNTLSTILKNREKLEKMASTSSVNMGKKRMRLKKRALKRKLRQTPPPVTLQEDRDLGSLFHRLRDIVPSDGTLGAFLYVDEGLPTTEETTIQQIAADLREEGSDSDEETDESTTLTTAKEARSALLTLKKFATEQGIGDMCESVLTLETKFEDHILKRAKQTTITDHFRTRSVQ